MEQSDSKAEAHFGLACKEKHLQACYHQAIMMYTATDQPTAGGSSMTTLAPAATTENSVAPKIDEKVRQHGYIIIYQCLLLYFLLMLYVFVDLLLEAKRSFETF